MKKTEKKKEWVCKSYWKEFHDNYPDPPEFRSFIASKPTFIKIFNYCSVPSIFVDVRNFPFDKKITELETITEDEANSLREAYWKAINKNEQEWLDYLINLFDVVCSTINFKKKLDSDNKQQGLTYTQNQILDMVEDAFRNFISVNEIWTASKTEYIRRINKWFPLFGLQVHYRYDSENKTKNISAVINHLELAPDEIDPATLWDIYSVVCFQKHGFDDLFDSKTTNYEIQHYYKGKLYFKTPFKFQIAKRYESLLKRVFSHKGLEQKGFKFEDAELSLLELTRKYNPEKGVRPAGFFKNYLKFNEGFGQYTSEAGDLLCEAFCKGQKRDNGTLPCEYETELGYCTDPSKKKRFISDIEASGVSFDEIIDLNKEDSVLRKEIFLNKDKEPKTKDPETALIHKEGLGGNLPIHSMLNQVIDKLKNDKRLNEILEQMRMGNPLSGKDRQYHSRWIREAKKLIGTS